MIMKINVGNWLTKTAYRGGRQIYITHISFWVQHDEDYGRMQAWFRTPLKKQSVLDYSSDFAWDTVKDGDIYDLDDCEYWLKTFTNNFLEIGFTSVHDKCIWFSESGAQSNEYVDFDIRGKFVQELRRMFPPWAICDG